MSMSMNIKCLYVLMYVCLYVTQASGRSTQGDVMSDKEIKRKGFLFAEERYFSHPSFPTTYNPSLPPSPAPSILPLLPLYFPSFQSLFLFSSLLLSLSSSCNSIPPFFLVHSFYKILFFLLSTCSFDDCLTLFYFISQFDFFLISHSWTLKYLSVH